MEKAPWPAEDHWKNNRPDIGYYEEEFWTATLSDTVGPRVQEDYLDYIHQEWFPIGESAEEALWALYDYIRLQLKAFSFPNTSKDVGKYILKSRSHEKPRVTLICRQTTIHRNKLWLTFRFRCGCARIPLDMPIFSAGSGYSFIVKPVSRPPMYIFPWFNWHATSSPTWFKWQQALNIDNEQLKKEPKHGALLDMSRSKRSFAGSTFSGRKQFQLC